MVEKIEGWQDPRNLTPLDRSILGKQKMRLTLPLLSCHDCGEVAGILERHLIPVLKEVGDARKLAKQEGVSYSERTAIMRAQSAVELTRNMLKELAESRGISIKEGRKIKLIASN